jgi:large repetitive protein
MVRAIRGVGALALVVAVCLGISNTSNACSLDCGLWLGPKSVTLAPGMTQSFLAADRGVLGFQFEFVTNASGATLTPRLATRGWAMVYYTAGATADVTDVIRVTDASGLSTTATIRVATDGTAAPLVVSPSSVTLAPLASQSFTASGGSGAGYAWAFIHNASGGSLSAEGVYAAGPTGGVTDLVGVSDSSGNSVTAVVTVVDDTSLSVLPSSVTVTPRASTVFIAMARSGTGYSWEIFPNRSGGTLSHGGFQCRTGRICYTAGATGDVTDVVRVTDSLGGRATAIVTVTAAVAVSPSSVTLAPGASQNFTASGGSGTGYVWVFVINASGGSLSADGAYTAGSTGGVLDTVGVRDSLGILGAATVTVTTTPLAVSPPEVTLAPGTSQNFTASDGSGTGYVWAFVINASGGSLSAVGAYTAGATGGVTDVVGVTDSMGGSASAKVTVTATTTGCGAMGGGAFPLLALGVLAFLTARRRGRPT